MKTDKADIYIYKADKATDDYKVSCDLRCHRAFLYTKSKHTAG